MMLCILPFRNSSISPVSVYSADDMTTRSTQVDAEKTFTAEARQVNYYSVETPQRPQLSTTSKLFIEYPQDDLLDLFIEY